MAHLLILQCRFGGVFWNYIRFFVGLGIKTFLVAVLSAVLVGVILGVLSQMQNWPPEGLPFVAGLVGLPITLCVAGWVGYLQLRDFSGAQKPA